jgi:hypothetical protein
MNSLCKYLSVSDRELRKRRPCPRDCPAIIAKPVLGLCLNRPHMKGLFGFFASAGTAAFGMPPHVIL